MLGQVRLTNGSNHFEGHVEVYYSEQWGTICDDNWDLVDAEYVATFCTIFHLCCLLFTVLYASNLDSVRLLGLIQVVILEVETHQYPSG